jgi:hypothetical protein
MVRKSPLRHTRHAHSRNGHAVKEHAVGSGAGTPPNFKYPKEEFKPENYNYDSKEETEEYFLGKDPRKTKEYRQLLKKGDPKGLWSERKGWKTDNPNYKPPVSKPVKRFKFVTRKVYNAGSDKPYYFHNKQKNFIKNKGAIYGSDNYKLIKVLTANLKAREI